MKKIKIIAKSILLLLVVSSTFSCQDAIDIEQPGRLLDSETFKSIDDLEAAVYGIYTRYDHTVQIRFNAVFTDEVARGISFTSDQLEAHILNSTSAEPNDIWGSHYRTISALNKVLAAAETNIDRAEDPEKYDALLGQLYALRAYSHFDLQSYFTTDYADDTALGVIILDYIADINTSDVRKTNGEVFTFISEDLDRAESLLNDDTNPIFVTKDFIIALRARMATYRENYTLANQYASDILSRWSLADKAQYFNMYEDSDNTEVIFKLERVINDGYNRQRDRGFGDVGTLFAFTNATASGGQFLEVGRDLYNQFNEDNADIRFSRNINPSKVVDPDYENNPNYQNSDILPVNKYSGSDGAPLMNDHKIFRVSEMVFIQAEALAAANDLVGAATSIKTLRDARFGTDTPLPVYATQQEAFGDILDERRKELFVEGHRWLDLKRLGERANRTIQRDPADCSITNACSLPITDHRFTLPIPVRETNINPALEQNPGY